MNRGERAGGVGLDLGGERVRGDLALLRRFGETGLGVRHALITFPGR